MVQLPDKVIGIDKVRISRGLGKICKCSNRKYVIDSNNRRVYCSSCGAVVDPYDALYDLAFEDEERTKQVEILLEQQKRIANYKPWLKVIKRLESQYRGNKVLPTCPRCSEPFYLEELTMWLGKPFAEARIKNYKEIHKEG